VSGVEGGAVEWNRTVKDENGKELPGENTMSLQWNTTQQTPVSVASSNVAPSAPYAPWHRAWHRAGIYNFSIKAAKSQASLHTCLALRTSA
jgi:hypothetical protein